MPRDDLGRLNFDCPEAYRQDELLKTINNLLAGKEAWSPKYDLATNTIIGPHGKVLAQSSIIIVEGLFAVDLLKDFEGVFKVYLEIDYRTASNRRLKRDTQKYPEVSPERIYSVFNRRIWPNYLHYVAPQKEKADLIIDEALSRLED
jgi:uridine kinase